MKTILTAIYATLMAINPVFAAIMAPILGIAAALVWINAQMAVVIAKLDTLVASNFSGTLNFAPFGLVNTLCPLSEAMAYFVAWLAVFLVCAVIRMAKAFIPTLAS